MLKYLRKKRRGIFGGVILGLVSLTMIGFGVEFFARENPNPPAVTIGDTEIGQAQYYNQLERSRQAMRAQLGEQYQQYEKLLNLPQQALDQMIDRELLQRFYNELGLVASQKQVNERILSQPFFASGKSQQNYRAFLQAVGMTGEQLEAVTASDVLATQLRSLLSDFNNISDAELRGIYRAQEVKKSFQIATFDPAKLIEKVEPSEEELRTYFEENIERYRIPAKVSFEAVSFRPAEFASAVELTEEDVRDSYEQTQDQYQRPAAVSFRQVVFKKQKDDSGDPGVEALLGEEGAEKDEDYEAKQKKAAETVLAELEQGADFSVMVEQHSEDQATKGSGGRIEWASYASLEPAVKNALSRLEVGELSSVVQTDKSFYILELEAQREKSPLPFEEVKESVKKKLQMYYAPEYARAEAGNFGSQVTEDSDTSVAALARKENKLLSTTSEPLAAGETLGDLGVEATNTALTLEPGEHEILEIGDRSVVIQTKERVESRLPELDSVRQEIAEAVKQEKSQQLARETAEQVAETVQENPNQFQQLVEAEGGTFETTELSNQNAVDAGKLPVQLRPEAFGLEDGEVQVFKGAPKPTVVRVTATELPSEEDFAAAKDELRKSVLQNSSFRLLRSLIAELRDSVEITPNQDVLDKYAT